jgi:hypothetical protein
MKMRFQKNPKATFFLVHEQKEVCPLCGGKIEKTNPMRIFPDSNAAATHNVL